MPNTLDRLRSQRVFDKLYKLGFRQNGQYFLVRFLKKPSGPTQFGIVISKKIDKRSVIRNRHKRQVKALLNEIQSEIKGSWDVIITIREKVILRTEWKKFREELRTLLKKVFSS